jgi:uncharacterized protein
MLGRLARWLLLMGYDTEWVRDGSIPDLDCVARALEEGRIFLTRDTRIPEVRGARKVVLRDQDMDGQMRQLIEELDLRPDPALFFSRCSLCNEPLTLLPVEEGRARAPERAKTLPTAFFECPRCRKLYWSGTHVANTLERLKPFFRP